MIGWPRCCGLLVSLCTGKEGESLEGGAALAERQLESNIGGVGSTLRAGKQIQWAIIESVLTR